MRRPRRTACHHVSAAEASSNTITALVAGTSCPTLQFKIQTYVIKTDTTTRYDGGSCTSLQAGSKLTALSGSRPNNNEQVLYATQITIQSSTPAPAPTPAPGAPAPVTTPPAKPVTPAPAPVPVSFETTVTVSTSGLNFDTGSNTYTYVWKTDKTWTGSCRQLTLKFRDGTLQRARFQFK